MKSVLALSTLIAGAALLPAAGFAGSDDQYQTTVQTTATSTADSSIASKIKAEMAAEHVSGVSVAADNSGVVSLTGAAATQADLDKAVSIAHSTAGVTAVNNNATVKSAN